MEIEIGGYYRHIDTGDVYKVTDVDLYTGQVFDTCIVSNFFEGQEGSLNIEMYRSEMELYPPYNTQLYKELNCEVND